MASNDNKATGFTATIVTVKATVSGYQASTGLLIFNSEANAVVVLPQEVASVGTGTIISEGTGVYLTNATYPANEDFTSLAIATFETLTP